MRGMLYLEQNLYNPKYEKVCKFTFAQHTNHLIAWGFYAQVRVLAVVKVTCVFLWFRMPVKFS